MKNLLLKNLGIFVIIIAAIVLVCSYFFGWNNNNGVQFGSLGAMIVGLILYIVLNKRVD